MIHAESYPDITIIESNNSYLEFEWTPQNMVLNEETAPNGNIRSFVDFEFAVHPQEPGTPDLPFRSLTLGIPSSGKLSASIMQQESITKKGIDLASVPYLSKGNLGITEWRYDRNEELYNRDAFSPSDIVALSSPQTFRDMPVQRILLHPVRYNPVSRDLVLYEKIRVRVTYNAAAPRKQIFRKRGKLDDLYGELLLNFDQARNWQTLQKPRLMKRTSMPGGTYYRISVAEDGLYKVTANTLSDNGINLNGVSTEAIHLYNNGGHELSTRTNAELYNPVSTSEIPLLMFDQNNNNLFDENDYFLFYGKHVNGWFYSEQHEDFMYQQHTYANENYYWLNLSGSGGKRMEIGSLTSQSGAAVYNYFIERFHYEEDVYNLLASGPDWYGHRFFGRSGNYSKSFELKAAPVANEAAVFDIQIKGGSGITYGDDTSYRYYFTLYLNGEYTYSNANSTTPFLTDARERFRKVFPDNSFLNDGTNTLEIQYSGNDDACSAYLDWFELSYPRLLQAENDQINFYTTDIEGAQRYQLEGFSETNDLYVFDVTRPADVRILEAGLSSQGGNMTIDLPAADQVKNLFVSSLTSAEIHSVSSLMPHTPGENLLDVNNRADFLIVTHKTFVPFAEELAELRRNDPEEPLITRVVSTDDIYFYFNNGVQDPTAIRNFIRYAYYNWTSPSPSYVLLFGDGHYDYRNITLPDTNRVPPFEIYADDEVDSRTVDNYYVDLNFTSYYFSSINADLAIGRLPMESKIDCRRYLDKLKMYEGISSPDGWQIVITFVADDEVTTRSSNEWLHQRQTETVARLPGLAKFIKRKIYLSGYPAVAGGLKYLKPEANEDIIDYINQGTLIINYIGHGSPTTWAHESVFNLNRDLSRINNPGKLPFLSAATCDFGKYDDPHETSFTEALIWKESSGVIGVLAAVRLVYSGPNARLNAYFYRNLFPSGQPSRPVGEALLLANDSSVNDQKYHIFADPTMRLADPREELEISSINPDTLKALSRVEVEAHVTNTEGINQGFNGGAVLIVNDARFDSVNTGGGIYYSLEGPLVFKGEVSVESGTLNGNFIVPKSIRYAGEPTGKLTIFAWDPNNNSTALGYNNTLLLNGSIANIKDDEGPEIDIYFQDQESFTSGDLIRQNPVLIAELSDESGINMTGATGYKILLQIDDDSPKNVSGFFSYERDRSDRGFIRYPMDQLEPGEHILKLSAFDNLNNLSDSEITFSIAATTSLTVSNVVNYPNPFRGRTDFTFQTNRDGAEATVKIYTVNGRLIQELEGYYTILGYNELPWDGRDRDGDALANGVYLYKIILRYGDEKVEKIEKMVVIN